MQNDDLLRKLRMQTREGRAEALRELAEKGSLQNLCCDLPEPWRTEAKRHLLGYAPWGLHGMDRTFILAPTNGPVALPKGVQVANCPSNATGQYLLSKATRFNSLNAIVVYESYGPRKTPGALGPRVKELTEEEFFILNSEEKKPKNANRP